jgi:transposase
MLNSEQQESIVALDKAGESYRSISKKLSINRKSVSRFLSKKETSAPAVQESKGLVPSDDLLRTLFAECDGWVERIHEKLSKEEGFVIGYSTLTKKFRELNLSKKKQKSKKRFEHVEVFPGDEMQHDTSPYNIILGNKKVKITASVIYLRYSKMIYLKFYLRFQRYDMKCFLHEALMHFGHSAKICVIDNTNLARLRGVGYSAEMNKEMASFGRRYGFEFICHEIKHSNRKAGNERAFWTTETNFLPGRTFKDLVDLNTQAHQWAMVERAKKANSKTKLIPAETFEIEKPYLAKVPIDLPEPMLIHNGAINPYGWVEFKTNFYWIPGKYRHSVKIIEQSTLLKFYREKELLVSYTKAMQDVRGMSFSPKGSDPSSKAKHYPRVRSTHTQEKEIEKISESSKGYLKFILEESKGISKPIFIRALYHFSHQISKELFIKTIERSHKYKIINIDTIEKIAEQLLNLEGQSLPSCLVDFDLENRESFKKGSICPSPDLSIYDLEKNEG